MTASPKVPQITINPYPRAICVKVDRKRSIERKASRHHPSSTTRGSRRPKISKDLDEQIVRSTSRYDSNMHQME
jgi:hypothetical protein